MPHFPVLNPESASTPLRVVSDSACVNRHSGLSFNELIKAVPNALNDITDVQLRWRMFPQSLAYDLSKAYHSLATGERELHLRRFLYRFSKEESWQVYAYRVVAFGDMPAALALELAKELCAEQGEAVDKVASKQLLRNSLVDDVGGGGNMVDILRMRGTRGEDGSYSGTVPKVLATASFRAKALVASGTQDPQELEAMGGKFLGVHYDPGQDEIALKIAHIIRMSKKRGKQ